MAQNPQDHPVSASGCRDTTIYMDAAGGRVFLTESGAVGLEFNGRVSVHTIERWLAYSWNDLGNTQQRNFPNPATPYTSQFGHYLPNKCDTNPDDPNRCHPPNHHAFINPSWMCNPSCQCGRWKDSYAYARFHHPDPPASANEVAHQAQLGLGDATISLRGHPYEK